MDAQSLINQHRELFHAFAQGWQCIGAGSYAVWGVPSRDEGSAFPLVAWPHQKFVNQSNMLRAHVRLKGRTVAEIWVDIETNPENQRRLETETRIIAQYAQQAITLEAMTRDLVQTQDQLVALYQLAESLRDKFVLEDILNTLTQEILRLSQAGGAFIMALIDGEPQFGRCGKPITDSLALAMAEPILSSGQERILTNSEAFYQSAALLPVRVQGRISAVMGVYDRRDGDFTSPDLKLLRAFAEQAGIQIEKVLQHQALIGQTKLRAELDVAADIQTRLLKIHLPHFDNLDIFAYSRPAKQVGGDFYDLIGDGRSFTFAVGDVTGKGMSAALLMAMSLAAFRVGAKVLRAPSPSALVQRLNEDLYDNLTDVGMFITLFVGYYDADNEHIFYTNAGHSPVIYFPYKGQPRLLSAQDIPIGVLPDTPFKEVALPFHAGDMLIVATDGFSEATNDANQLFGHDALLRVIQHHANRTALSMANAIYAAVEQFSADVVQDDDQTLLIIKRTNT